MDRSMGLFERAVEFNESAQNYLANGIFDRHGETFTYWAFGFVFFYFGLQKPSPVHSPVYAPVTLFVSKFGIDPELALLFIGTYEMTLGLLFVFKQIRVAFWLFLAHQVVAFTTLLAIPYAIFQPPWIKVLGIDLPWALGGFSAFLLKNVIFVGAFMLLASNELGTESE